MSFQGLRKYRTDSPAKLDIDLQRQNLLLEKELASLRASFQPAPSSVTVSRNAQAQDGQLVLADATRGAIVVVLPSSGARVLVAKKDASGNAVNVFAANDQLTINGVTGPDAIATQGLREYFGDGQGNWWRR